MASIVIEKISTAHPLFGQVFALREKVLRRPLGLSLYNEDTSADALAIILIAKEEEEVIGCILCQAIGNGIIKLRQMAVDDAWQSKGIGKTLVHAAEEEALRLNTAKVQLHARQSAVGFYERLGYTAYGPVFTEVGIPHIAMEKLLQSLYDCATAFE